MNSGFNESATGVLSQLATRLLPILKTILGKVWAEIKGWQNEKHCNRFSSQHGFVGGVWWWQQGRGHREKNWGCERQQQCGCRQWKQNIACCIARNQRAQSLQLVRLCWPRYHQGLWKKQRSESDLWCVWQQWVFGSQGFNGQVGLWFGGAEQLPCGPTNHSRGVSRNW